MEKTKIISLCKIRFGLHYQPKSKGAIQYLQARHFDALGRITSSVDVFTSEYDPKQLLKDGDVVLVAKGNRNIAWCYRNEFGPMIASSVFFVITPNQQKLYPEYLAVILNLASTQQYFLQHSEGSSIQSVRRSVLEELMISLPEMTQQQNIVSYNKDFMEMQRLREELIEKNKELYNAVIAKMIN